MTSTLSINAKKRKVRHIINVGKNKKWRHSRLSATRHRESRKNPKQKNNVILDRLKAGSRIHKINIDTEY